LANAFRAEPLANVTEWAIARAHARYGLSTPNDDVTRAWALLSSNAYNSFGTGVWDSTGIAHMPAGSSQFEGDRRTPSAALCSTWTAWGALLNFSAGVAGALSEPLRYDLVNLGREVYSQLSSPMSQNFSDAVSAKTLSADLVGATGEAYLEVLADVDELVATDQAFLLGPWLAAARGLAAEGDDDCFLHDSTQPIACADFFEWNARAQLSTWKPCLEPACHIMFDQYTPTDYASKHWSGLISSYYRARAEQVLLQALEDAGAGAALNQTAVNVRKAQLAFDFQRDFGNPFPLQPVGDAVEISTEKRAKAAPFFASCGD